MEGKTLPCFHRRIQIEYVMLKKINHVNIVVSNLDETKAFFIQLGFEVGDESELSGEWISSIVGLPDVKAKYVTLSLPGTETKSGIN